MIIPLRYIIKRVIRYLLTLIVASTVVFIIPRLVPGDPIQSMVMRLMQQGQVIQGADKLVEEYRRMFGLDGPLHVQYIHYLENLLRGNLGLSIMAFPTTVQELIWARLPWTIGLLTNCVIISWVLGNILGAILGWRASSKTSVIAAGLCLFFSQIPYYILAIILSLIFVYYIPLFPSEGGYSMGVTPGLNLTFIIDVLWHSTLPALSIILVSLGGWALGMRSLIVSVQGEDFILFAEAKGIKRNVILMKYAFRNALLPQVTGLAMSLGFVVSGSMLTEYIFSYPGIGSLFITAAGALDYNVLQGVLIIIIFCVLTANLIIDLLYPLVDPRIHYERK